MDYLRFQIEISELREAIKSETSQDRLDEIYDRLQKIKEMVLADIKKPTLVLVRKEAKP